MIDLLAWLVMAAAGSFKKSVACEFIQAAGFSDPTSVTCSSRSEQVFGDFHHINFDTLLLYFL